MGGNPGRENPAVAGHAWTTPKKRGYPQGDGFAGRRERDEIRAAQAATLLGLSESRVSHLAAAVSGRDVCVPAVEGDSVEEADRPVGVGVHHRDVLLVEFAELALIVVGTDPPEQPSCRPAYDGRRPSGSLNRPGNGRTPPNSMRCVEGHIRPDNDHCCPARLSADPLGRRTRWSGNTRAPQLRRAVVYLGRVRAASFAVHRRRSRGRSGASQARLGAESYGDDRARPS